MSKEKQTVSKQLAKCPFCNEELERHCTGRYYMHKLNGCILQHFCFEADDELSIEAWNTRKPLERIVERLEEVAFADIDETYVDNAQQMLFLHDTIEIVKEEGGMNE